MKALIIINFKGYKEAAGDKALTLARELAKVKRSKYTIVVAPSLLTLKEVAQKVNITVLAQHADPVSLGACTGSISVDELKSMGVAGTILNHSERKIHLGLLGRTIELCRKKKLKTIVCASTLAETRKISLFRPNYIAYEPAELIGGNVSVTNSKPEVILKAVEAVSNRSPRTKVLCGAGIHNKEDIGQALLLGTHGVLIGHAVPKAKNPRKFLSEMLI